MYPPRAAKAEQALLDRDELETVVRLREMDGVERLVDVQGNRGREIGVLACQNSARRPSSAPGNWGKES